MKKALITGICGQIGSYMSEYLLDLNYEVYGLDRRVGIEKQDERYSRINHILSNIELIYGDIRDYSRLYQIIKEMELNPGKVYQRLKAIDIDTKDEDRLKSLADKNNTTPIKLMTTILVENSPIE